ncbi:DUF2267 domain-containing protein [Streptomyces sp. B6B3]|uniref:DUF2267 domain-containing protein n=1 Tax=Streptomyces sp. B6B3 TaxID=3153570 RepID=UPI00325EF03D
MEHDEFIGQVQARARLDSRGAAESASRASLETLGERITPTLAEHVAAQLPREIGEHLRRVARSPDLPDTGMRMTSREFFDRVSERSGADVPKAVYEARCVVEVVDEATQGALMRRVRQSLDDELAALLFSGSTGHSGS